MMGGADVAIARDTTALATNPAGLAQIANRRLDVFVEPTYAPNLGHEDSLGDDNESKPAYGAFAAGGYAQRLNPALVAGLGFYVQGGVGFAYRDFDSGFGASGDLSSLFSIFKVVPGAAWKINDKLSLGTSPLRQ